MLENYLIVHKSILPEYYEDVLKAKHLLEDGKASNISQAAKMVGISRSTFYKYKDMILEPSNMAEGRKAVLSMMLEHENGILSAVISAISEAGGSILTISQNLPIHGKASVTITLDISKVDSSINSLVGLIQNIKGVENPRLIAID